LGERALILLHRPREISNFWTKLHQKAEEQNKLEKLKWGPHGSNKAAKPRAIAKGYPRRIYGTREGKLIEQKQSGRGERGRNGKVRGCNNRRNH